MQKIWGSSGTGSSLVCSSSNRRRNTLPTGNTNGVNCMNIFYIIGVVVVVLVILGFLGIG